MKRLLLLLLTTGSIAAAQTPFLRDSAAVFLKTLSVEIGPRPMGSPSEQRALAFAVAKFEEFGLQEAYVMPMRSAGDASSMRYVNTNSGVAVGVLKGATDRIILIGGHIDSASPEIPGANDDGSGAAVVIELARALALRHHQSTIVFCLFGGEEQGLRGSEFFVKQFPQMDKIALMLQVDMANGSDWLLPMYDLHDHSAPTWLVSAAYEEFTDLGYSGLYYPTHFYSLNYAFGRGGAGSDHEPFLARNIPAIDFTSDVNDPIHTPQDNWDNFKLSGLKRSGDLVYRLVERFDAGIPEERSGHYVTVQIGGRPFFIPMLLCGVLGFGAIAAGVAGLVALRRRRTETDRSTRPKLPRLKLFFLALLIQAFVWLSENVVGLIKNDRFPWLADSNGYFLFGFFAALAGIWVALQISGHMRFSRDPYRYYLGAFIMLVILIVATGATSIRLMAYPASALLLLGTAALVRQPALKILLWFASPHLMYRLLFNEVWGLISHGMTEVPGTLGASLMLHAVLMVFFALWSFPFLLGFASILCETNADILWISKFRKRYGIAIVGVGVIGCVLFLSSQPTFTKQWMQRIRVEQTIDLAKGTATAAVRSGEYLHGSMITFRGQDSAITTRTLEVPLGSIPVDSSWITIRHEMTSVPRDSGRSVDLLLSLSMKHRPYTLSVRIKGKHQSIDSAVSPLAFTAADGAMAISWYSFPDSQLTVPVHFFLERPDSVTASVEAVFIQQSVPVTVTQRHSSVISRTTVRQASTLLP